jgi:hypothetical protein
MKSKIETKVLVNMLWILCTASKGTHGSLTNPPVLGIYFFWKGIYGSASKGTHGSLTNPPVLGIYFFGKEFMVLLVREPMVPLRTLLF